MVPAKPNGSNAMWLKVLIGAILVVISSVIGALVGHQKLPAHPVAEERTTTVIRDIATLRQDVKDISVENKKAHDKIVVHLDKVIEAVQAK